MADSTTIDAATDPFVKVTFSPDPGKTFLFDGIHAHEELGRPFLYKLDLSSGELNDTTQMVGAKCTIAAKRSKDDSSPTYFNGIVTRVDSAGMSRGAYHYKLEVRPWIWLLSRVIDCKIFQKKKPFDIIISIFTDAGFSDYSDKRQASAGDVEVEYCVQYRESSFDFVTRLMEEYGIYYFFKHEDGKHTLNLADDPNSHDKLSDAIPFADDLTEARSVADHIWYWNIARSLESAKVTYQDYNFTTPTTDLTAKSIQQPTHDQYNSLEVYDYPGLYDLPADGTKLTDVRVQAIGKNRSVYDAISNARGLHAGWQFTLSDHTDATNNRDYLITESEFSIAMTEGSSTANAGAGETMDTYRVNIKAIPNDVHFRLARKTPRPMIRGPQTAVVAGASGEEIDPDQYGRVKVRFYWDRSDDATGPEPSCWIRVAQASAGISWGSMFIPRIKQEVVVEFLEGNPDRPLITGVVYNANVTVPYPLPDNKTRSTIKTNSSPGGNGFNELRFEDKAGEEEVFFQAQKDFTKKVLNSETITVHKDTTTTVETGNHSTTVSKGDHGLTVSAGGHKIDVSVGKSEVTAATSITLTVGSSSVKIEPSAITLTVGGNSVKLDPSGVTTTGTMVKISGSASVSVSGATISLN